MNEYTTKKIAELLGVSKPTVQKYIRELGIKPVRKENNNRAYYSYEDTVVIIKTIKPSFDFSVFSELSAKPKNETEKPQNQPQSTEKSQNFPPNFSENTAKPQTNEELELLKRTLAIIEKQLDEKEKQIEIKDNQIKELNDRLAEAMELNKGLQYITAADKTTELLEADTKRKQQDDPPIVVEESDVVDAEDSSSSVPQDEIKETEEPEPQKKGFWKRLFGE